MPRKERCCGRRRSTRTHGAHRWQRPTLYNDRLYVAVGSNEDSNTANPNYSCCTFRGSVAALDIASGRVLWKSYTVLEEPQPTHKNSAGVQQFGPAGAAIASSPTIDAKRGVLYVGHGPIHDRQSSSRSPMSIAAFDLSDGKLRWVKQLNVPGQRGLERLSPVHRSCEPGKRQ